MIKTVVFDLGNVLISFYPKEYLRQKYSEAEASFLYTAFFATAEWADLDRGTQSEKEVLARYVERHPEKELLLRALMDDFYRMFDPIETSVEILRELKQRGFRLYYLSNFHLQAFEYVRARYRFFKYFDGGIISAWIKMLKPEAGIYTELVGRYGLDPHTSLFIDDTVQNTEAARELGFQTIHLEDPALLRAQLHALGVDIRSPRRV